MNLTFLDRWLTASRNRSTNMGLLGGGVVLIAVLPLIFGFLVFTKRAANTELREALAKIQDSRGEIRLRNAKKEEVAARYQKKAPPLAGFIEQTAKANKLSLADSGDLADIPHGKKYSERATKVSIKKGGMLPVARFLETIEESGYPVIASRLGIRKRSGEANSFDIDMTISAYDRVETANKKEAPK